jgi:hypothetical protein
MTWWKEVRVSEIINYEPQKTNSCTTKSLQSISKGSSSRSAALKTGHWHFSQAARTHREGRCDCIRLTPGDKSLTLSLERLDLKSQGSS